MTIEFIVAIGGVIALGILGLKSKPRTVKIPVKSNKPNR